MKLDNKPAPNFNGICVNSSKMQSTQKKIATDLSRVIIGDLKWNNLSKQGVDVVMLSGKKNNVNVRLLDSLSGEYIRNKKGIIQKTANANTVNENIADFVLDTIKQISEGKIKRPKINSDNMINGDTALFRIQPKLYDRLLSTYDNFLLDKYIAKDMTTAKELAVDMHLINLPETGFNFNF